MSLSAFLCTSADYLRCLPCLVLICVHLRLQTIRTTCRPCVSPYISPCISTAPLPSSEYACVHACSACSASILISPCLCSSVPQVVIPSSVYQEETEAAPSTSYHITSIAPAPKKCNEVCMPFYLSVKELCTHTLAHVCTCVQELTEPLSQAISIKLTIPTYICPRALFNATSLPANRATTAARHAASACTL